MLALVLALCLAEPIGPPALDDDDPAQIDMGRWPSLEKCVAQVALTRSWISHVEGAIAANPNRDDLRLGKMLGCLKDRLWYWEFLEAAHRAETKTCRQACLNTLHAWMTDEDFWSGRLPHPHPLELR